MGYSLKALSEYLGTVGMPSTVDGDAAREVVGVATLALGLSLVVRINESFRTIEEDDLQEQEEREGKG